eukprot:897360-Amphidinium_carterae.1
MFFVRRQRIISCCQDTSCGLNRRQWGVLVALIGCGNQFPLPHVKVASKSVPTLQMDGLALVSTIDGAHGQSAGSKFRGNVHNHAFRSVLGLGRLLAGSYK